MCDYIVFYKIYIVVEIITFNFSGTYYVESVLQPQPVNQNCTHLPTTLPNFTKNTTLNNTCQHLTKLYETLHNFSTHNKTMQTLTNFTTENTLHNLTNLYNTFVFHNYTSAYTCTFTSTHTSTHMLRLFAQILGFTRPRICFVVCTCLQAIRILQLF